MKNSLIILLFLPLLSISGELKVTNNTPAPEISSLEKQLFELRTYNYTKLDTIFSVLKQDSNEGIKKIPAAPINRNNTAVINSYEKFFSEYARQR